MSKTRQERGSQWGSGEEGRLECEVKDSMKKIYCLGKIYERYIMLLGY